MTVSIAYGTTTLTYTNVTAISCTDKSILLTYIDTTSANAPTTKQFSESELGSFTVTVQHTAPTPET